MPVYEHLATLNLLVGGQNRVAIPKHVIKKNKIEPFDKINAIISRCDGVARVQFRARIQESGTSVTIPQTVVDHLHLKRKTEVELIISSVKKG